MNFSYVNFRIHSNAESAAAFVSNDERQVTQSFTFFPGCLDMYV